MEPALGPVWHNSMMFTQRSLFSDNVSNLKVGDRVAYSFSPPIGSYCEVRDFDAQRVVKLTEYITNDEAASILLQGMTVEYLFERLYKLQKDEVLSEIEMMPKEQQEYIDLFNELEVSQALFEQLESRRLGFSILEASTIGDVRVIDEAYYIHSVNYCQIKLDLIR